MDNFEKPVSKKRTIIKKMTISKNLKNEQFWKIKTLIILKDNPTILKKNDNFEKPDIFDNYSVDANAEAR